ncbi:hypothetical protein LSH36_87g05020 [Paralvinella palmiformis]|uniref:Talin N-terminal F0 domain-containing protein n=1 Tax=Paralvinella palmiformis TaxID=53620 RepID=A0AAD9NC09_9ANNE|nr:hypothetical protein LSH36_87g05020 [Paralvinella palmiformis]
MIRDDFWKQITLLPMQRPLMKSTRQELHISMNEITSERGDDSGIESSNADSGDNSIYIRVSIPEIKIQKCLQFHPEDTVWMAKERVLSMLSKEQLKDSLNYGLYCPPMNGRAGKFLDEERPLKDYPLPGPIGFLEFKYKRRVYKLMQINPRRLKQLHCKSNLKQFLEHVKKRDIDKINKMTIRGLDPNFHEHETGETPLSISCQVEKPRNLILALVGGGAHLDYRTRREGLTPLHRAAQRGNYEAMKTFLELGASPNYKDAHGLTALYHCVCHNTSPKCVELLLHDHSTVGVTDEQGWTEAHQACKHGRVQHLEPLLFYGADMNAQNLGGNTPLHVCAINNQEECARVLLFRGADKNIINIANQDAFHVAVISGNRELADVIKNFKPEDVVPFQELPRYNEKRRITISAATLYKLQRSRSDPRLNIITRSQPSSPTTSSSSMPHFLANGSLFQPSSAGILYENVMTKDDCVGSEASMSVSSGSSFTDSFTSDNGPMMRKFQASEGPALANNYNTGQVDVPGGSSPLNASVRSE